MQIFPNNNLYDLFLFYSQRLINEHTDEYINGIREKIISKTFTCGQTWCESTL